MESWKLMSGFVFGLVAGLLMMVNYMKDLPQGRETLKINGSIGLIGGLIFGAILIYLISR